MKTKLKLLFKYKTNKLNNDIQEMALVLVFVSLVKIVNTASVTRHWCMRLGCLHG